MKITVLIPSDSTLYLIRSLQKEYIAEFFKKAGCVFFPSFPLWGLLCRMNYEPEKFQKNISSVNIQLPILSEGKIILPIKFFFKNGKDEYTSKQNHKIILAEKYSDQGNAHCDAKKTETIISALNRKHEKTEIASRVFKIGYADMKANSWELMEFKWIKTAPKKATTLPHE